MGIMTVGVGAGLARPEAWSGILVAVLMYAVHHGLAKGALFLGVAPAHSAGSPTAVWWTRLGLVIPALALAGAPFTSGAAAKLALMSEIGFLPGAWVGWVKFLLPMAAVGTTLMMARYLWLVWPRTHGATESIAAGTRLPWAFLVGVVVVGMWLLPGTLALELLNPSPAMLWKATWPLLLGGALAWLGAKLTGRFPALRSHGVPAGDMAVWFGKLAGLLPRPGVTPAQRPSGPGEGVVMQSTSLTARTMALLKEHALRTEQKWRGWSVAGFAALLLLAWGFSLLAGGRR